MYKYHFLLKFVLCDLAASLLSKSAFVRAKSDNSKSRSHRARYCASVPWLEVIVVGKDPVVKFSAQAAVT